MPVFDYRRIQQLANRSTGEAGKWYRGHRAQSMKRIRQALSLLGPIGKKVLIAGVGNANDLDLLELKDLTRELWLVDIDEAALTAAVSHHGLENAGKLWIGDAGAGIEHIDYLRLHAAEEKEKLPLLLTELGDKLEASIKNNLSDAALPLVELGTEPAFDLVVSQCLLSQIHWPVAQIVWDLTGLDWKEGQSLLAQASLDTVIPLLARSLELMTLAHLIWLKKLIKPEGLALVNTDVNWREASLYGTDTVKIIEDWRALAGDTLCQVGKTEHWSWQLDGLTEAKVNSTLYARRKLL